MLARVEDIGARHDVLIANIAHAGDGNLHPVLITKHGDDAARVRAQAAFDDIVNVAIDLGGTVTGEHGVGVEKLNSMCVQFSPDERALMEGVKRAFDPAGLLNPGKVIPTLQRCAEYGKMHVKKGLLPFPELERF